MRKGQTAMEYLMTYGWAILIIIVVVAALYSLGVFSVSPGVSCSPCFSYFAFRDYDAGTVDPVAGPSDNGVIYLVNGPRTITLTGTQDGNAIPDTAESFSCGNAAAAEATCAPGVQISIGDSTATDGAITNARGTDVDIVLTYVDQTTGVTHTDTATIHNPTT